MHQKISRKVCKLLSKMPVWPTGTKLLVAMEARYHPYIDFDNAHINEAIDAICERETMKRVQVSGTGALVFFSRDRAFCVPLGLVAETGMKRSYRNWKKIMNSNIRSLVTPDWVGESFNKNFVLSNGLLSACIPANSCIDEILHLLQNEGRFDSIPAETLAAWRRTVENLAHDRSALRWMQCVFELEKKKWCIGPTHGDLTPSNVMQNNGTSKVLDLDRFSWNGVQVFDVMHSRVESYCKKSGSDWIALADSGRLADIAQVQRHGLCIDRLAPAGVETDTLVTVYILERLKYELRGSLHLAPAIWKKRCRKMLDRLQPE